MTIAVANTDEVRTPQRVGTLRLAIKKITLDNSYPTGGWALTPTTLGLRSVLFAWTEEKAPGTTKYHYVYDVTAAKLQVYTSNGAAPAALAELDSTSATQDTKVVTILALGL